MGTTYLIRPPCSNAAVSNSILTGRDFNYLARRLVKTNFSSELFGSLGEFIVGAYFSPISLKNISKDKSDSAVNIADKTISGFDDKVRIMTFDITADDTVAAMYELSPDKRKALAIGDFRDYGEYTKIQAYVPFVGFVDMDNNLFFGDDYLWLYYSIDPTNGTIAAVMQYGGSFGDPDNITILEESSSCFVPITLTTTNAGLVNATKQQMKSQTALNVATAAASGVVGGLAKSGGNALVAGIEGLVNAGSALMTGMNNINSLRYSATSTSSTSSFPSSGCFMPYFTIRRYKTEYPVSYGRDVGYPCGLTYTLSQMAGFTTVSSIHIPLLSTQEETEELYRILHNGVIINNGITPPTPEPETPDEPLPEPEPGVEIDSFCPFNGDFYYSDGAYPTIVLVADPHYGYDMVGVTSPKIYCPTDGWEVMKVGLQNPNNIKAGAGYYVRLKNIDTTSRWYGYLLYFMHLTNNSSPLVVGQQINRGDFIGVMGSTGRVTGAHLHFEARYPDGGYIEPSENILEEMFNLPNPGRLTGGAHVWYNYDWDTGVLTKS